MQPIREKGRRILELNAEVQELLKTLREGMTLVANFKALEQEVNSYLEGIDQDNLVKSDFHMENALEYVDRVLDIRQKMDEKRKEVMKLKVELEAKAALIFGPRSLSMLEQEIDETDANDVAEAERGAEETDATALIRSCNGEGTVDKNGDDA